MLKYKWLELLQGTIMRVLVYACQSAFRITVAYDFDILCFSVVRVVASSDPQSRVHTLLLLLE